LVPAAREETAGSRTAHPSSLEGNRLRDADARAKPSTTECGIIQLMRYPRGELRMPTFPVRFDGAPLPVAPAPLLSQAHRQGLERLARHPRRRPRGAAAQ